MALPCTSSTLRVIGARYQGHVLVLSHLSCHPSKPGTLLILKLQHEAKTHPTTRTLANFKPLDWWTYLSAKL